MYDGLALRGPMSQICDIHVLHAVTLYIQDTVQTMHKWETSCHKLVQRLLLCLHLLAKYIKFCTRL